MQKNRRRWVEKWYDLTGDYIYLFDDKDLKTYESGSYDVIVMMDYKFVEEPIAVLKECLSLLKQDGHVLINCYNRLGLRFFAGAPEEESNIYFEGVQDYPDVANKYTFSRREWIEMLNVLDVEYRFYYPYPEHVNPIEIFSDVNVNNSCYGKEVCNKVSRRYELFNEEKVFQELANNEVLQYFANSFLIEINPKKIYKEYTKYSVDRKDEYKISTSIINDGEKRTVIKEAESDKAVDHITKMVGFSKMQSNDLLVGKELSEMKIEYQYLYNNNINGMLYRYYIEKDKDEFINIIDGFYTYLMEQSVKSDYYIDEFKRVFGDAVLNRENMRCLEMPNIDMIFDNIFVKDDKKKCFRDNVLIIDGEWIFDFAVPVDFVFWRAINELYNRYHAMQNFLKEEYLLDKYKISASDVQVYEEWNAYFTKKYVGAGETTDVIYAKDILSLNDLRWLKGPGKRIISKIYWKKSEAESFDENKRMYKEATLLGDELYEITFRIIDIKDDVIRVDLLQDIYDAIEIVATKGVKRMTPMYENCGCGVYTMFVKGPAAYSVIPESDVDEVTIRFRIKDTKYDRDGILENYYLDKNRGVDNVLAEKETRIYLLENEIQTIYGSKSWKIISKIRNIYRKFIKKD
ncbi:MAG: hypothetical protein K6B67_00890 [Lachnospiraceae bacterium]|nr:hypothetical protein [Lachnospiraceae bacterium]